MSEYINSQRKPEHRRRLHKALRELGFSVPAARRMRDWRATTIIKKCDLIRAKIDEIRIEEDGRVTPEEGEPKCEEQNKTSETQ
jgi:hypothetical protein